MEYLKTMYFFNIVDLDESVDYWTVKVFISIFNREFNIWSINNIVYNKKYVTTNNGRPADRRRQDAFRGGDKRPP